MITRHLTPGARVLTTEWNGLVMIAREAPGVVRTVDYIQRNAQGSGKSTNRVYFTDGTSALAKATSTWISWSGAPSS